MKWQQQQPLHGSVKCLVSEMTERFETIRHMNRTFVRDFGLILVGRESERPFHE